MGPYYILSPESPAHCLLFARFSVFFFFFLFSCCVPPPAPPRRDRVRPYPCRFDPSGWVTGCLPLSCYILFCSRCVGTAGCPRYGDMLLGFCSLRGFWSGLFCYWMFWIDATTGCMGSPSSLFLPYLLVVVVAIVIGDGCGKIHSGSQVNGGSRSVGPSTNGHPLCPWFGCPLGSVGGIGGRALLLVRTRRPKGVGVFCLWLGVCGSTRRVRLGRAALGVRAEGVRLAKRKY